MTQILTLLILKVSVFQMPLLSSQFLTMHRELRLAHLALGVMTMGYIWQEGEKNIAEVPLSFFFFFYN